MVRPFSRLELQSAPPPRRKGTSIIATSTPERRKLEEAKKNRGKKSLASIEEADFSGSYGVKLNDNGDRDQENNMKLGPESESNNELMEPAVGDSSHTSRGAAGRDVPSFR